MTTLTPEIWPWPDGTSLATAPGPLPATGSPPLLLLLDRGDPRTGALETPLRTLLVPDEERRLQQLRREADRQRFLLGRGLLRLMLGAWLGRDPAGLVLAAGAHGKPELILPIGSGTASRPRFNVSHSGDLILLGFHACLDVGVDVEQLRPVPEWEGIARRCLPPQERNAILARPENRRSDAFLQAWCRLEARLKARGLGLVDTATCPDAAAQVWTVALPPGYTGAAALV